MKKNITLLPLACSLSLLPGFLALAHAAEPTMRVEPTMSVRHSDPSIDVWYKIGRHHQNENRLGLAAEAYRHVLSHDKQHVDARNALATVYSMQNRFEDAITEFQTVLQANPKLAYVHNNLGYAYFLKKDYAAAIRELGTAMSIEPGNARAFGNLALAYEQMGDAGKTRSSMQYASADAASAVPAGGSMPDMAAQVSQTADKMADLLPLQKALEQVAKFQSTPVVAAAVSPVPSVAPMAAKGIRIEIANGTKDEQLAVKMSNALRQEGVAVTRVTALRPYTQYRTVILYRDGFHKQALELSRTFAVPPAVVNNTRTRKPYDKSDVRLVLGKTSAQAVVVASSSAAGAAY